MSLSDASNTKSRNPVAAAVLPPDRSILDIVLAVLSFAMPAVVLLALAYPPPLLSQGQAHRIFYIHVPTAWIALYAPLFSAVAGLLFLFRRKEVYDVWSLVNARLAMGFAIAVLISGPIWANVEWGTPWNWKDSRLVSFFVLSLALGGYFLVRTLTENPGSQAVYGAVMAVLSAVAAVLTWYSIRLIAPDTHPTSVMGTMSPKIRITFWLSVLGFHMLFWIFLSLGLRQEYINRARDRMRARRESGGGALAAVLVILFGGALFMAPGSLVAQPAPYGETAKPAAGPDLSRARELLAMEGLAARAAIEQLSEQEAKELVTQVLYVARPGNPDLDRAFLLVQHLEAIRATALAQRRLNSLLWVVGLTLGLFTLFLIYVLFDQRRALRDMRAMMDSESGGSVDDIPPNLVYRGE